MTEDAKTAVRIALGIEYDGRAFCGWQTQPTGCAAQDKLESALAQLAGESIATVCAGRTDAGVHALAQVVHFDTAARRPLTAWVRGANALLPRSIAVTWARVVAAEFHARYAARERCYRYVLLNRAVRPAAEQGRVGWFHLPLALDQMQRGAQALLGHMLFEGEGVERQPVLGLMFMSVARDRAAPTETWIFDMQRQAVAIATESERRTAMALARIGPKPGIVARSRLRSLAWCQASSSASIAAICRASSNALSAAFPAGTTRLTRPMR